MPMDFARFKKMNDDKPNQGVIEDATLKADLIKGGCGDGYSLYLKLEGDRIIDARYTTTGCGFGVAALETLVSLLKGSDLAKARQLTPQAINAAFEFPEKRLNYPQSAWELLQVALEKVPAKVG